MVFINAVRQGVRRSLGLAQPKGNRSFADVYVPKADTSMDHVYGDNSFRLPYDVSLLRMTRG